MVKEKLFIDSDMNLEKTVVKYCRAKESIKNQIKLMKEGSSAKLEVVQTIKASKIKRKFSLRLVLKMKIKEKKKQDYVKNNSCSRCKTKHAFGRYPARGKVCN